MSTIAMPCPFCGGPVQIETYQIDQRKGRPPRLIVYCDNDNCAIKPCTEDTSPQEALSDAAAWGYYGSEDSK